MTNAILDATKDAPPSAVTVLTPSPAVLEKEQLDRDIAKAQKKSAMALEDLKKRETARKEAPAGVDIDAILDEDPMERLARDNVPEAYRPVGTRRKAASKAFDIMPGVTMRCYWGEEKQHRQLVGEGWEPVTREGEHVSYNELKLYKRDIRFSREEMSRTAKMSQRRLATKDKKVRQAAVAGGGAITEDVLEISEGKPK